MTQRPHLVFRGGLGGTQSATFRDVDDARRRYVITHPHRVRNEERGSSPAGELSA